MEWGSRSWRSLGVVLTSPPCKALWQPQGEPSDLWEPHGVLWDPYMHPWEQHGGPGNLVYPQEPHWWTAKEASHEMHTLATGYNSDWVQLAGTTGNSLQKPFHTFCNSIISFWHLIWPKTDWTKNRPMCFQSISDLSLTKSRLIQNIYQGLPKKTCLWFFRSFWTPDGIRKGEPLNN